MTSNAFRSCRPVAGPWWAEGRGGGWRGMGGGVNEGDYESRAVFWYEGGGSKYYADMIQIWQYKVFYFIFSSAVDIFVSRALPFSGKAGYQGCVSLRL